MFGRFNITMDITRFVSSQLKKILKVLDVYTRHIRKSGVSKYLILIRLYFSLLGTTNTMK